MAKKKIISHASNGNIKPPLKNLLKCKIKKCEASFSLKENPLKIRNIWCKQKIKVEAMQFIYSFRHKLQNQGRSGDASLPRTQEVWYHSLQTSQLSDHLWTCIEGHFSVCWRKTSWKPHTFGFGEFFFNQLTGWVDMPIVRKPIVP